ncbi:MAG: hypothetical protein ABIZ80_07720 [Bryobacteraceae bacterium]
MVRAKMALWAGFVGELRAETVTIDRLTPVDIAAMYSLYALYFEATCDSLFRRDLAGKQFVMLLRDREGEIRGFSTGAVLEFTFAGEKGRALFSGDTIIHHEYWGGQTLPLAFAAQAGRLKAERPDEPLYWLLISKGYRTYRYLPLFFFEYYPRWDREMPSPVRALLEHLAERQFGDAFHPVSGLVQFPESRGQLRPAWAEVREPMRKKPDVRFFLQRNSGYRSGDELVCLAELACANVRPLARAAFLAADVR